MVWWQNYGEWFPLRILSMEYELEHDMPYYYNNNGFWTSAQDTDRDLIWRFEDGHGLVPMDYAWWPNEPANSSPNVHCARMRGGLQYLSEGRCSYDGAYAFCQKLKL